MPNVDSKSGLEGRYLARCTLWNWHDNSTIDIIDLENNVIFHLDEWQTMVFFEADGNITAEALVSSLQAKYHGRVPQDFNDRVFISTEELAYKFKVIELWSHKDDLPYYFELPLAEQDQEQSLRLMAADGRI